MSLWKDNTVTKPAPTPMPSVTPPPPTLDKEPTRMETAATPKVEPISSHPAPVAVARAAGAAPGKESLIASDLTIEGKIEGGGSVRIAGKFKGDVNVQGDLKSGTLTVAAGARMRGQAECGWGEGKSPGIGKRGNGHDAESRTVS